MGMANEMKNLSEEILASYKQRAAEFQQRLKDNADVVKEVQKHWMVFVTTIWKWQLPYGQMQLHCAQTSHRSKKTGSIPSNY